LAEQANRARDDFFSMLSHELRTPLMAVLAWTALLKENRLEPGEAVHALELIERNGRAQRRLVDDLLDVSRIVTGRMRIDARPVASLAQMIGLVVDSFRPAALAKHLTIETALETGAGVVNGDIERLQQVVWNLLSNAIRYTPPEGRIQIRYSRRADHVELLMRDSGQGIPAEALPHLFERYWQGRGSERRSQGLGLGLAIAQRIIELHGGKITAASEGAGRGATFTVLLPVVCAQDALSAAAANDPDASPVSTARMLDAATSELEAASGGATHMPELPVKLEKAGAPNVLSILLVEDHQGVARACRRLLMSHGYGVACVSTLAAAVEVAATTAFDVVICDLTLPDGSGIEVLSRLKSRFTRVGRRGELPAIAISGSVYEEDVARTLQAGFAAHLAKPFDEEGLINAVHAVTRLLDPAA
jgi:CheY-like chemotaxis protein